MMPRLLLLLLLTAVPVVGQAPGPVTVLVRQSLTGSPLPNAEVLPGGRPPSRLTDGRGEVRLVWPERGSFRLVVRQIGFAPFDSTWSSRPAAGAAIVQLNPVAYRLPELATATRKGCPDAITSLEAERTAVILEQLQIGAEHFEAFRREYAWTVTSERRTAAVLDSARGRDVRIGLEQVESAQWGAPYQRGKVLVPLRTPRAETARGVPPPELNWAAHLLFVSALASPRFWENHCFRALPSGPEAGPPTVRLAFSPRQFIRQPDWRGTAMLDSATAELRRVEFELVNLDGRRPPTRLEGATDFVRVSPFVMIPAATRAQFWVSDTLAAATAPSPLPELVQRLTTLSLRWHGARRPPGVDSVSILDSALVALHQSRRRTDEVRRGGPPPLRRDGAAGAPSVPTDTVEVVVPVRPRPPRR